MTGVLLCSSRTKCRFAVRFLCFTGEVLSLSLSLLLLLPLLLLLEDDDDEDDDDPDDEPLSAEDSDTWYQIIKINTVISTILYHNYCTTHYNMSTHTKHVVVYPFFCHDYFSNLPIFLLRHTLTF